MALEARASDPAELREQSAQAQAQVLARERERELSVEHPDLSRADP